VRLIVFVCDRVPLVPVMVIVYVPGAAVDAAVKVACEVPLPLTEAGTNAASTPTGRPDADKVTADEKPPIAEIETVELALLPWVTVSGIDAASEKSGA